MHEDTSSKPNYTRRIQDNLKDGANYMAHVSATVLGASAIHKAVAMTDKNKYVRVGQGLVGVGAIAAGAITNRNYRKQHAAQELEYID